MRKLLVVVTAMFLSLVSNFAQSGGFNSPFSRYGIGDNVDPNPIYLRQMGGINASYADTYHANPVNPASLSFLRATSFDVGLSANNISLEDNLGNSSRDWSGNLEYLSLAFPLTNPLNEVFERQQKEFRLGMGFTLQPVSRVAYHILNEDSDPEIGDFSREFVGSGGSYKVQWGNSIMYKSFSLGLNMGYQFGKIRYDRVIDFQAFNAFDNRFSTEYNLKGFTYNFGAIYQFLLNKEQIAKTPTLNAKAINLGIFTNGKTSINTTATSVNQNLFSIREGVVIADTLSSAIDVEGTGTMPSQFGIGATYYLGTKLSVGVNYVLTRWSQYENEANPESLSDASMLSFGGFFRPNVKSFNYKDRIYYRFGASIGEGARSIQQNQLKNYSLSAGLGLPFVYQRKISHINIGAEFGKRSTGNLLSETYVKLGVGLTFNDDEWFIKRKYN